MNTEKNKSKLVLLLFCLSSYCQNENMVSLGINVIDDSFTSTYNPINISETWHIGKIPSYFSFSKKVMDRTFLEIQILSNNYNIGKLVDGSILLTDKKYMSIDLFTKYRIFHSDEDTYSFDPFVALGTGYTAIEKTEHYTINYGLGLYFWFPKSKYCDCSIYRNKRGNFGILISTFGKSSFKQSLYGNQIQHTLGLVYRFK
jgi:OOP family OmpA-OmpF porin